MKYHERPCNDVACQQCAKCPGCGCTPNKHFKAWVRIHTLGCAWIAALVGCDGEALPPLQIVNESSYSEAFARAIVADVEAQVDETLDLGGFTLHMTAHAGDGCGAGPDGGTACTNLETHHMWTPFVTASSLPVVVSQARLNFDAAGLLCHELGHVYFYETTGDGDASHMHTEWYDYNAPGTTCYAIASDFFQPSSP